MKKQNWRILFLILGVALSALGIEPPMKIGFMGIQIVGGLGGVIILFTMSEVLFEWYFKRKKAY